jgi:hypothetical protein
MFFSQLRRYWRNKMNCSVKPATEPAPAEKRISVSEEQRQALVDCFEAMSPGEQQRIYGGLPNLCRSPRVEPERECVCVEAIQVE